MGMGDEKEEMPQIVLFCWYQLNVLIFVFPKTTMLYMYN